MLTTKKLLTIIMVVTILALLIADIVVIVKIVRLWNDSSTRTYQLEQPYIDQRKSWLTPRMVGPSVVKFWNGQRIMVRPIVVVSRDDFVSEEAYQNFTDWLTCQRINTESDADKLISEAMNKMQANQNAASAIKELEKVSSSPFISPEYRERIHEVIQSITEPPATD